MSSREHRITCVRQFAIYLNSIGYDAYIVPEIKRLNRDSFVPYIFTHEQISSVLRAADDTEPREVARNMHLALTVIFRILYGCGLRFSEVVGLQHKDVNLDEGIRSVKPKQAGTVIFHYLIRYGNSVLLMQTRFGGKKTVITFFSHRTEL